LSYESNGETDAAVKDLEMVVRLCPGQCNQSYVAHVHRRLGDLYMKRKDYETAVLDYTESVRLAPEVADAYSGRAKANRQLERHEAADADAVKVVELQGAQFGAKPPEMIELGILNYRAMSLPQPPYPDFAARYTPDREEGDVEIAVEVSETGQVTKAWGQNGDAFLYETAISAAERVRFKPLMVNGKPSKFTGRVRYTFTAPK
jgi:TonB family protein